MNTHDIGHLRLSNQQISRTHCRTPAEVVAWLGAAQAQDYAGAKWSLGLRLPHATDAAIEQAIADRTIIRTWPMRGTLHFVPAEDARWMLKLLTPRVIAGSKRRYQELELDDATIKRSQKTFAKALRGSKVLTREEMIEALERAGISPAGQRAYHMLGRAAMEGLICFGPPRGAQQTFTLLDEWAPAKKELGREEGLAALAGRFFRSHGPASYKDFQGWTGLPAADARLGFEAVKPNLESVTVDGETYWLPRDAPAPPKRSGDVYALPGFDEYVLGYKDRSAVLDPAYANRISPGANGVFYPTIVAGGQIVGTWKRTIKKEAILVEASPFTTLTKTAARAFAQAAKRYGEFMGMAVKIG